MAASGRPVTTGGQPERHVAAKQCGNDEDRLKRQTHDAGNVSGEPKRIHLGCRLPDVARKNGDKKGGGGDGGKPLETGYEQGYSEQQFDHTGDVHDGERERQEIRNLGEKHLGGSQMKGAAGGQ